MNLLSQVREKLLSKTNSLERREKAKKLRELKKFGKKVSFNQLFLWRKPCYLICIFLALLFHDNYQSQLRL